MRIGVLDVGSNTAHLLVADTSGGMPLPVRTAKTRLRLAERVGPDGMLDEAAIGRLSDAVSLAVAQAREMGVEELFGYATATIRDAPNSQEALSAVRHRAGVTLGVLSGIEEAELTYLAARRWMGWRAGPLLVLDIGGGSVEVAYGRDVTAELAVSLPLGAGRLTRERLPGDPPSTGQVKALREYLREEFGGLAQRLRWARPRTAVATSRTFHQLARLCGAPPPRRGPFVQRLLHRKALGRQLPNLARLPTADRARLPGISAARAGQTLAGALVAHTAMDLFDLRRVMVCPWALREGILLRRLESAVWWRERSVDLGTLRPVPMPARTAVVPIGTARRR
ncbi:Ppx/GppA phosphatase family protein [Phytohabitans kaempferiae]|uniref:Ppx/GppA phosphatase family protein n=1 Tax=Phytohabitans kaempferiae TaxID=1620943 RepID=A0ABV6M261_9ACTN